MLKPRIIPCLDVSAGRVRKGIQFENLADIGDPVKLARFYDQEGADELCFLDITASHENRPIMLDIVAQTAEVCFMPVTVGGGVTTLEDIRKLLLAGADKVSINSAAVKRVEFIREAAQKFGEQCIIVAIDAKCVKPGRWEVFTHGGRRATGIDALAHASQAQSLGAGEILLTSMDRDGMQNGYDLELTRSLTEELSIPVIASGGAGNLDHLVDGIKIGRASAILVASIFHSRSCTIRHAKQYLQKSGVAMRML